MTLILAQDESLLPLNRMATFFGHNGLSSAPEMKYQSI